jgi:hypothetical protein
MVGLFYVQDGTELIGTSGRPAKGQTMDGSALPGMNIGRRPLLCLLSNRKKVLMPIRGPDFYCNV